MLFIFKGYDLSIFISTFAKSHHMKKPSLLIVLMAASLQLTAQQWQPAGPPQKLSDIVAGYEQIKTEKKTGTDQQNIGEGTDYQFKRWKWYWEHHLDENGYLVSPLQTLQEWNNYQQTRKNIKAKTTNQSQWSFQGPDNSPGGYNGLGRINALEFHPTDSNTFIIGSAGGGAWRTSNGGQSWLPLYNNLPVLGVSDVDYNPQNPNTIYLCTGDGEGHKTFSIGVLKSTDGGNTWNPTGLQYNPSSMIQTYSLVVNPLDSNSLTLGTSFGIHKSHNGGASWTQVSAGNSVKQLVYHPTDTNIVYAATRANGNNQILRSHDGGNTWSVVGNIPGTLRIALAVTPADVSMVKAIAANGYNGLEGIYNSTDTGHSFVKIFDGTDCSQNILSGSTILNSTTCDGQGSYDLTIAIDPIDTAKVYVGGVNMYHSLDGGYTWQITSQWDHSLPGVATIHADKHFHGFNPLTPHVLYECNDGGIYKTLDPASNVWTDLSNGLGITQFYRNAVSDVAKYVLGGAQDNGTKAIEFTNNFQDLTGGDGMECQLDPTDTGTLYTSYQNGGIYRITIAPTPSATLISGNIAGQPAGAWVTPFLLHPASANTIIAGYDHVHLSSDKGDTWTDISPTFNYNDNITRLTMTPADNNKIVALVGENKLVYTNNLGTSWQNVINVFQGMVSDILLDPWNKDLLWVTYGGYSTQQVAAYDFSNGTWTPVNDSLPNLPVLCIARDSSNGTLYIGTDVGVFYRDTTMTAWSPYNAGLPTVQVNDLGINYATDEIWAATFGRGMWKSPRHNVIINSVNNLPLAMDVISVSPNPTKGQFTIHTGNKAMLGQSVDVQIISYSGSVAMNTSSRFDMAGECSVNATNLAKGNYLVTITNRSGIIARTKLIIR